MDSADRRTISNTDTDQATLVNRESEKTILTSIGGKFDWRHLYIPGPYGSGKTLLARRALETYPDSVDTYYISCLTHNTQYKVLSRLYALLTGDTINPGYHTAQLHDFVAQRLKQGTMIIVLDDIDFLLLNDGNDLLYFLSRFGNHADLHIVGISANHATLSDVLDERTYSSLHPRYLPIDSYTAAQASEILTQRLQDTPLRVDIDPRAITTITERTTNIRLGLHWLAQAVEATSDGDTITADRVIGVQQDATNEYRAALLEDLTPHHTMLLEVITHLTGNGTTATTGTIYDRYTRRCRAAGTNYLTLRRVSDFLTQLELLHLITVTHHDGGKHGKTREIQVIPLQQL